MSDKTSLGDRMKLYEKACRTTLPIRMPVIIRLDARAFHTYTRGCKKPIDNDLANCMNDTAKYLCENIQGCQIAYVQSDEITLFLVNYDGLNTQSWFGNSVQKMVSISAAMASAKFTTESHKIFGKTKIAEFDSRVFVLPKEEVNNAFVFRQQDAIRNSVQMLARSMFSHKECNNKNQNDLKAMCLEAGTDWNNIPNQQKMGRCVKKVHQSKSVINQKTGEVMDVMRSTWIVDNDIPNFTEDKEYIEKYIIQNKAEVE